MRWCEKGTTTSPRGLNAIHSWRAGLPFPTTIKNTLKNIGTKIKYKRLQPLMHQCVWLQGDFFSFRLIRIWPSSSSGPTKKRTFCPTGYWGGETKCCSVVHSCTSSSKYCTFHSFSWFHIVFISCEQIFTFYSPLSGQKKWKRAALPRVLMDFLSCGGGLQVAL